MPATKNTATAAQTFTFDGSTCTIKSPVIVTAAGYATAGGHTLGACTLATFAQPGDPRDSYDAALARATRARRDGFLLCLRPTADRPACVDLGAHAFADASLQADFSARALVVDPYDADGEDIRDRAPLAEVAAAA